MLVGRDETTERQMVRETQRNISASTESQCINEWDEDRGKTTSQALGALMVTSNGKAGCLNSRIWSEEGFGKEVTIPMLWYSGRSLRGISWKLRMPGVNEARAR